MRWVAERESAELESAEWSSYLDSLSFEMRGTTTRLEVQTDDGTMVEATNMLLQSLLYDQHADVVEITLFHPTPAGPAVLRHVIDAPQHIEIDSPAGILPRRVMAEAGDGTRTIVLLHAAPAISS
jgi:hypothetical protein